MKTIAKLGLVGLALAASSAHADVFLPNTGNGELTLFVRNDVTGAVYARGLQIRLDSVLTQAQINAGYTGDTSLGIVQQINYSLGSVGPDANLAGFLATAGTFTWTIMAGDNSGLEHRDPGCAPLPHHHHHHLGRIQPECRHERQPRRDLEPAAADAGHAERRPRRR